MRTFARGATTSAVKLSVVAQAPANGATVSGTIAWAVKTAGSGVYRVDFAVDGAVKSTDSRSPFAYGGGLDTTKLGNGAHTLTATAYATRRPPGQRDDQRHRAELRRPRRSRPPSPLRPRRRPQPGAQPRPGTGARRRPPPLPPPPPRSTGAPGSATS